MLDLSLFFSSGLLSWFCCGTLLHVLGLQNKGLITRCLCYSCLWCFNDIPACYCLLKWNVARNLCFTRLPNFVQSNRLPSEIVMHDAYIGGQESLVKPVTWHGRKSAIISSCLVLPPEIVIHYDAYIGGRSENNIKCVVHDNLRWKNQTTLCILPHHWLYEWFSQFHSCGIYSILSRSPSYVVYQSSVLLKPPKWSSSSSVRPQIDVIREFIYYKCDKTILHITNYELM